MSLLGEIEAATPVRRGPPCTVGMVLASLPLDDRHDLTVALGDKDAFGEYRHRGTKIAEALRKRNILLNAETIQRHRRGLCRCAR